MVIFRFSLSLLQLFLLSIHVFAQTPIIGQFRAFTTRQLTTHMHYCSACYPELLRTGYCHRLALGKYFRIVCKRNRDNMCIGTSTTSVNAAFDELTSNTPQGAGIGGTGGQGLPFGGQTRLLSSSNSENAEISNTNINIDIASSFSQRQQQQQQTGRRSLPGLDESLVCSAFGTIFVTRDDSTLGNLEDAELVSKGLEAEVVFEMSAAFKADKIAVEDSDVETVLDKVRPSGTEPGAPIVRTMTFTMDGDRLDEDELNMTIARQQQQQQATGVVSPMPLREEEYMFVQDLVPRAMMMHQEWTHEKAHAVIMADTARLDMETVVRKWNPLPQSTRIRIYFTRSLRAGRVRQIFRLILLRQKVLRVYRKGFRVVQRGKRAFDLYAYFSEDYRRVYRSIRTALGRRR